MVPFSLLGRHLGPINNGFPCCYFWGKRLGATAHPNALAYFAPSPVLIQDLKDHMREAGDVGFSDIKRERGEAVGYVEYSNREDMDRALTKLDRSAFK